jgi:dolichol-phosphate mannosyltransferase
MKADVDFVMPVYNEAANIRTALSELYEKVLLPKRVLIVYDLDSDDTIPVVRELQTLYSGLELVKNHHGRGVLNAIRSGIDEATSEVVIVTMADLSDDLVVVPEMVRLIQDGAADIVCASRYMKGGRQIGGPRIKGFLSRIAGRSLHRLTGIPTQDVTNAFRAYRTSVLRQIPIESRGGFEISLELTVKAYARGYRITQVPCTWRDRSAGTSRFRIVQWLPKYLRWYVYALTHRPQSSRIRREY